MVKQIMRFAPLRVYKNLSTVNIFNSMMCNRIMKMPTLVKYSRNLYELSSKLLGKGFVDMIITKTFCKVLTAGNTLQQASKVSQYFRSQNIPVILDYCAQGQLHNNLSSNSQQSTEQANSLMFSKSAQTLVNQQNQMISIKFTGLVNIMTLKFVNDSVRMRDQFWKTTHVNNKINAQNLFQALTKVYQGITEQQVLQYLRDIHHFNGDIKDFQIDQVGFKMNHYPFYLYDHAKNQDSIIKLFFPASAQQKQQCYNLARRLKQIAEPQKDNKNGFKILVDAEQSYVQLGIQSFSQQMQCQYNKERTYILPTIQNYLKRSVNRSLYQIALAQRKNLKFGAKLVRGAYIVEQTKLASQLNIENPIVPNFQSTTHNYLESFRLMVSGFKEGEVIVATHNEDTVNQTIRIHNLNQSTVKISFAQLLGLADHLTWKVKAEKYTVYKYLPWAKTHVMIPYMIRRAEQLNQMRYPLDTQYGLLKHQLKERFLN